MIEEYIIGGMGHGTPIRAGGDEGLGEEGKYMLEVGISSTRHIARFWGLTQRWPDVSADGSTCKSGDRACDLDRIPNPPSATVDGALGGRSVFLKRLLRLFPLRSPRAGIGRYSPLQMMMGGDSAHPDEYPAHARWIRQIEAGAAKVRLVRLPIAADVWPDQRID